MDPLLIKAKANEILENQTRENSAIEYKASENFKGKILKTICAYGNNLFDNDVSFIFVGVEEEKGPDGKAMPVLPIKGVNDARVETIKGELLSLRPFTYPNVKFEVIENSFRGKTYLLIVVERQHGGPFAVTEGAEKNKAIRLKPGRYVRFDADSRLAKIDEEFELMRRFASYRFGSTSSLGGTLDDLDVDLLREFITRTESRGRDLELSKLHMAESLRLVEKGALGVPRVFNYALLMFSNHPDSFFPGAYCELITSALGSERRMEAKEFRGPIWKQYFAIAQYVKDYLLRTVTVREEGKAENRKVSNFPFAAFEELLANAIVHKNYENRETIQIYVLEDGVDIVNYNKPIPPLTIDDLNTRTIFYERRFENPEIRDMFKALGIIESFGSGIGAAKKACLRNGSAPIVFKKFPDDVSITSVHIPVSEEFLRLTGAQVEDASLLDEATKAFKDAESRILSSGYSKKVVVALVQILHAFPEAVFSASDIAALLSCSAPAANAYRARLSELGLLVPVSGQGKGHYKFA